MSIEQRNNFADFPELEGNSTSSIGGTWPPEGASFYRTKAFYDQLVNNEHHWNALNQAFENCCLALSENNSRIQFRAVVNQEMLYHAVKTNAPIEAVFELDPDTFGENSYLMYMSRLHEDRQPHPLDLEMLQNNVALALQQPRLTSEQLLAKAQANGYQVKVITGSSEHEQNDDLVTQITNLYSRFGWDRDSVISLLKNEDQLIGLASKDNQIVTAGLIEMASLQIGDRTFRIAEITEAATHSEHTNGGLYKAVSTSLLLELQRLSRQRQVMGGEVDLVFGECNGLSQGVLVVAAQQGRRFATAPHPETGDFIVPGILRQQVPINDLNGVQRRTDYNDLVPTSLTRRRLYDLYS